MRSIVMLLGCVGMLGCGGMSASDACESLTGQGFGSDCTKDEPGGIGAAAWEKYNFDLEEPKGKKCQVLSFKDAEGYDATVKAFGGAAALVGPHRYGNAKRRIFVQCNSDMPRDQGTKLEAAVSAL